VKGGGKSCRGKNGGEEKSLAVRKRVLGNGRDMNVKDCGDAVPSGEKKNIWETGAYPGKTSPKRKRNPSCSACMRECERN